MQQRSKFDEYRKRVGKPDLSDLFCFLGIIGESTSREADKVIGRAINRNARYGDLVNYVAGRVGKKKRFTNPRRGADAEAELIKAIVEYEVSRNKEPKWQFSTGGLNQLTVDFLLVREYMQIYDSRHLNKLCDLFGDFLLTDSDAKALSSIADEAEQVEARHAKVKPMLRPLWLFFMALCYALQEEENELTAADAFWLGLIDEVVGKRQLQPERLALEAEPDPSKAQTALEFAPIQEPGPVS